MDTAIPEAIDLRKYIDTNTYMERPHIRGRRVPVATIAYSARDLGWVWRSWLMNLRYPRRKY